MNKPISFNIRAYGLIISDKGILLCHESFNDLNYTKFPGGGLEFGEGLTDCIAREIREELGVEIKSSTHFYTTDFFQRSIFNSSQQLISVYYLVELDQDADFPEHKQEIKLSKPYSIKFQWHNLNELMEKHLTFPIDKLVLKKLQKYYRSN